MSRQRKEIPTHLSELTTEQAAAFILTSAFKVAEAAGLCPLCVMECAIEMMDKAEADGAIQHTSEDDGSWETVQ